MNNTLRTLRLCGTLLLFLFLSSPAFAQYTYRNGLYYNSAGQAHTYANGCFTPHSAPTYPPATATSHSYITNHWSALAADALRKAVEYDGQVKQLAVEYNGLGQALSSLTGRRGILRGYDPHNDDIGGTPYEGNTAFGVSTYSTLADVYGSVDRNVLHERFARGTETLATVAKDAHSFQGDLIDREGVREERLAEIKLRGEVAERVLKASEPQARVRVESRSTAAQPRDHAGPAADSRVARAAPLLNQFCASCHSGDAAKKGIVLDGSQRLTAAVAHKAQLAVELAHGLAGPAARKIVRAPMPPKSSDHPTADQVPELLAELGRLTL